MASVYTDDFERGHATGIALGGVALGALGTWLLAPGPGSRGWALQTLCQWLQEAGVSKVMQGTFFLLSLSSHVLSPSEILSRKDEITFPFQS